MLGERSLTTQPVSSLTDLVGTEHTKTSLTRPAHLERGDIVNHFVLYAYIFNYCIPVSSCIFFYSQIVLAVVKHEAALREQAKKMNVESLRQGDHVCTFPRVILAMRINLLENYPLFTG